MRFVVTFTTTVVVDAEDEDEAVDKASEYANGENGIDLAEIDVQPIDENAHLVGEKE